MWNRTRQDSMVPLAESGTLHKFTLTCEVYWSPATQAWSSFIQFIYCCNNHCQTSANECASAGIGKSSILRAMAGLWLTGEATLIAFGICTLVDLDASQRNELLIHQGKGCKVPWCRSGFPTPETLAAILDLKHVHSMNSMLNVWNVKCCESKLQMVGTCLHMSSFDIICIHWDPVSIWKELLLPCGVLAGGIALIVWYGITHGWKIPTAGSHLPSTPWWLQWCWEVWPTDASNACFEAPLQRIIWATINWKTYWSIVFGIALSFWHSLNPPQPRRAMMGPLLRKWGLQEARDWTATLSAGERQRLAFARLFMMLVTWTIFCTQNFCTF